ncbi:MAG: hypothetical protein RLZZ326_3962 [Planctomycetota bacterium]|jgi:hypothetical protein
MLLGREWPREDGTTARIEQLVVDANWGQSTQTVRESVSTRGTASAANVTPKTVTAALRWLKTCGLIWEVAKSANKGSASLSGVYPRPGQFVQLCETANRPRFSKRHRENRPPRKPR